MLIKIYSLSFAILLASCGGGGGGGGGGEVNANTNSSNVTGEPKLPTPEQYALVQPSLLTMYPSTGVPSSQIIASDYGMGSLSFPAKISEKFNNPLDVTFAFSSATVSPINFEPNGRLSLATKAWNNGWSGKGTTISVVDDFTTKSILYSTNFQDISRSYNHLSTHNPIGSRKDQASANITANVNYTWVPTSSPASYNLSMTHGDLVELIAGGNGQGIIINEKIKLKYKGAKVTSCAVTNWTNPFTYFSPPKCSDFNNDRFYLSDQDLQRNIIGDENDVIAKYKKTPGIAKDAIVVRNNVLLGAQANPLKLVSDIQGHLLNSKKTDVINLSMGSEIPTNGQKFSQVMDAVAKFPIPKLEAVIVVAAGNGGAPCASLDLSGCNALAVSMAFQESTGSSTIIAGALQGEGLKENIADYSTRAGILSDRYLLAPGDSGYIKITWNNEQYNMVSSQRKSEFVRGTSFAAPIISGAAAIIKQKFPSLSSRQVADILLLSANKDINNDGIADFSGVSLIYGHGKLDINRALDLAGSIK